MKRFAIALLLTGLFPFIILAQTAQQLEEGIKTYNELRDTAETPGIKPALLLKMADKSEVLLKKVIQQGSAEEVRTARYFLDVLALERAETYYKGTNAEHDLVIPTLQSVESEFDRLGPAEFPIRYAYLGKSYVINYTDFSYTRMKFYAEFSEMYVGKNAVNMKKYALRALEVKADKSEYLQYVIYYFLNNEAKADAEKTAYAQKFITLYSLMDTIDRRSLNEQKTGITYLKNNAEILLIPRTTTWDNSGELSAVKARELVSAGGLDSLACRFFDQAVTKGAPLSEAERIEVLDLYDKIGFKSAGLKLCNKMLVMQSATNCDGYDVLAKYYRKFGDALKSKSMSQSAEKCRKDQRDQAAAEARRQSKAARRSNRHHGYLGAYVLRIAQRPQYIDWGGTLDIPVGRTLLEFSYLQAINDQDYLLMERLGSKEDLNDFPNPHWDGFYAHFGFKKMERGSGSYKTYRGMLFTCNQRNYQPQATFVTPKDLPLPVQQEVVFKPEMTTYGFMINAGSMNLGKPFGIDMYMGVGPTYSIFKLNNANYSGKEYDFSNPFLQQRKEQFWGFQIRIGLTVGLTL